MENNIESLFVPYEQALALKELGFDEPCFGYHLDNKFQFFADVRSCNTNSEFKFYPTAPTFSQAFIWFREKYDLDVIFKPHIRKTKKYVCDPVNIRLEAKNTYEEAELECLKKLIEICCKLK
jgi:hypothetical protein